jgi:NodT family efflux transporter outer membrane factor (OMF) lipoprotein
MPHAPIHNRPSLRLVPLFAMGLMASACAVGPDYQKPDLKLTAAYQAPSTVGGPTTPVALETWWTGFDDRALVRVVERAGAQNLDLAQAEARLTQSRALARAAGAALLPTVGASGSAARSSQSLLTPLGEIGSHIPNFPRNADETALGLGATWEIDLFGGLRRQRDSARANAQASAAQAEAVRVAVAADAADAYLQVRAYQARLQVAEHQLKTQDDLVDLLNRRLGEGVSPERELHQAQALREGVAATLPPLRAGLEAQLNRLDVLMGALPGTYRAELVAPAPLPAAPGLSIAEGPAELLRRRPDILAAEQRLIAANAGIGAAIADYYPKISISGLLGVDSLDASRLFASRTVEHQISGGLSWRLFDFGRIDAEVAQAKGRKAEALAAYRASVFKAAEEVEDAVTELSQNQARAQALSRQIEQLTLARDQAQQAYEGGVISLVEVRDADRDLLAASDQLVQAQAGAARAAVAAYRALGGGWRPETLVKIASAN